MITATVTSRYTCSERQIDPEWEVEAIQQKLETVTGIPPKAQQWVVSLPSGNALNTEFLLKKQMKNYIPSNVNSINIRVEDSRPPDEQFTIDDSVPMYEMSDAQYQQRDDSVLRWKKTNHLGRFAPPDAFNTQNTLSGDVLPQQGARVSVMLKSGKSPNGTVAYVGNIPEIPGDSIWVGVALDTPEGKNDGALQGTRYFDSKELHGVFVKPSALGPITESPAEMSDDEI